MLHVFILIRYKEYINIYIFVIAFIRTKGWISFPCAVQHHQNRLRLLSTWFPLTVNAATHAPFSSPSCHVWSVVLSGQFQNWR